MLNVKISHNSLTFRFLHSEQPKIITNLIERDHDLYLDFHPDLIKVTGAQGNLFRLLYDVSEIYDIELV